jgi:hypothetical protein
VGPKAPAYDLRAVPLSAVRGLFERFHVYRSVGRIAAYVFAVIEDDQPVAAFTWQPPPPNAARTVCAALPVGVLALSRMVAVPHDERHLRHISKPLRRQMRALIDRTRWPVLVTYSDESVGHTGYVYKCSGWRATARNRAITLTIDERRVSRYSDGKAARHEGALAGEAWIQRWEHHAADDPKALFEAHWERVAIPGKRWRSGAQAFTYRRRQPCG